MAVAAAVVASGSVARAQPVDDPASTAAAQALFEQGLRAMDSGDLATACPKLAEVVRLEPRGAGARMKLALCYERQERLASAWATYLSAESAARTSGQRDRAREAHDAADRLKPQLSTLTVKVPAAAAGGFVVLRDGFDLGAPQWNEAVPVDGGEHVVELRKNGETAPRHRSTVVVAARGANETITIPDAATRDLLPPPANAAPPPPPTGDTAPRPSAPPPSEPPGDASEPAGSIPTWAIVLGVGGIALGGTAIILRAQAASIEADQEDNCGPRLDACPRDYDVEGTNDRKNVDFGLFVGFGVASVAALSIATIGAVVGLNQNTRKSGPAVAIGPRGFMAGGTTEW